MTILEMIAEKAETVDFRSVTLLQQLQVYIYSSGDDRGSLGTRITCPNDLLSVVFANTLSLSSTTFDP